MRTIALAITLAITLAVVAMPAAAGETVAVFRDADGRTAATVECPRRQAGPCRVVGRDGRTKAYVERDGYGGRVLRSRDGETIGTVERDDWRSGSSWRDGPSWRD